MTHLLDTNACIVHLRSRGNSPLSRRIQTMDPSLIVVCSVVRAELFAGAFKRVDPAAEMAKISKFLTALPTLPFDDDAALEYGRIRAELESRGQKIGANDFLIAAIALVNNLTVVTHNTGEFSRVPRLRLEDWQ